MKIKVKEENGIVFHRILYLYQFFVRKNHIFNIQKIIWKKLVWNFCLGNYVNLALAFICHSQALYFALLLHSSFK